MAAGQGAMCWVHEDMLRAGMDAVPVEQLAEADAWVRCDVMELLQTLLWTLSNPAAEAKPEVVDQIM